MQGRSSSFTLERNGLTIEVSPQGGSITRAEFHRQSFLIPAGGPDGTAACFPLVPFGNRIEFNSFIVDGQRHHVQPNSDDPLVLHGDGWLSTWDVDAFSDDELRLSFQRRADASSPYSFAASQVISVVGQTLRLTLSVTNQGSAPLPFGIGQHPFFARTDRTRLYTAAQRFREEREDYLPGAALPVPANLDFRSGGPLPAHWVNNAFEGWDGSARIVWPELEIAATVEADRVHDVFMLFAPEPDAGYFCLEPMSHLPNGHHLPNHGGLSLLSPGGTLAGTIAIHLETLRHE